MASAQQHDEIHAETFKRVNWNFLRGLAKRCWQALLPLVLPAIVWSYNA